ncbi:hypothetical protein CEXT_329281 [Caerostris extrusa]|uniref:Uncharacterized protein n=1 Tax=Caerostris extrusa TaxID=172846 RepID=A0AAV4Y9I9_CAEEX|nr:hypothetical protein CEXT_329281 [Caerostris extrusa]
MLCTSVKVFITATADATRKIQHPTKRLITHPPIAKFNRTPHCISQPPCPSHYLTSFLSRGAKSCPKSSQAPTFPRNLLRCPYHCHYGIRGSHPSCSVSGDSFLLSDHVLSGAVSSITLGVAFDCVYFV